MRPDIVRYRRFVDQFDMSEDQKTELIHTIWRIVEVVADRAFGLDPVQLAKPNDAAKDAMDSSHMLEFEKIAYSDNSLTDTFRLTTGNRGRRTKN